MVRLRSDRWYAGEGQSRSRAKASLQSSGSRRLISLCFLLALVILMMQKAADPQYVSRAFKTLGVPLEDERVATNTSLPADLWANQNAFVKPNQRTDRAVETDPFWQSTCDDLVPRLLVDLSENQIQTLAAAWFESAISLNPPMLVYPDDFSTSSDSQLMSLVESIEADSSDSATWRDNLQRFRAEWKNLLASAEPVSDELQLALTHYLDRRVTSALRDASPWMSEEHLGFWRLLQRSTLGGRPNPVDISLPRVTLVSTLQLQADSKQESNKGEWLRFRGSVRAVEIVDRSHPEFGLERYWLTWLRGDDGSNQPVAMYTANPIIGAINVDPNDIESYVDIEVQGIAGKRLAYSGQEKVEVAPTIFASEITILKQPERKVLGLPSPNFWSTLGSALAIGLAVAGIILTPIVYSFRKSSVPSRQRPGRSSKLPSILLPFLCILATDSHANDTLANMDNNRPGIQQNEGTTEAPLPPWVKGDQLAAERSRILDQSLVDAFTPELWEDFTRYKEGQGGTFPDLILKWMRLFRKHETHSKQAWAGLETSGVQLKPVQLTGMVVAANPVALSYTQNAWFQQSATDQLFHLKVISEGHQGPSQEEKQTELLTVFATRIPRLWLSSAQLRQPIQLSGVEVSSSTGKDAGSLNSDCMLASNVEWRFNSPLAEAQVAPPIPDNLSLLARLGWNLSFADVAADSTQKPLRQSESEAIFSLVSLLGEPSIAPKVTTEVNADGMNPMTVIAKPKEQIGRPISWNTRIVSGSRVDLSTNSFAIANGLSGYFQFDGFVNIGNRQIQYQLSKDGGGESIKFEREFPVTLIMQSPPAGWVPEAVLNRDELQWDVGKFVAVEGCFYRLWSYQSELLDQKKTNARQAAPLIIATRLQVIPPPMRNQRGEIGWFGYGLCFAILLILGTILYLVSQKDTRRRMSSEF